MSVYQNNQAEQFVPLKTIDCARLATARFPRYEWLVQDLLKPGLAVLAGSPKVGKSWMMLQLCLAVSKGEPFLGMETKSGTVLYLALEDGAVRLQNRVLRATDDYPENLYFSVRSPEIGEELVEKLRHFVGQFPDTRLVVIDTFQKIRNDFSQPSYAKDYLETSAVKSLADTLRICILLVHHTRKLTDSDCFNEISGTNGIAGSADTLMVLKKEKRSDRKATMSVTGRDIEDRTLELRLNEERCQWEATAPAKVRREEMPPILFELCDYVKSIKAFDGANGLFCEQFAAACKEPVNSRVLKNKMNLFRYELEDRGVVFESYRTASMRLMRIYYDENRDKTLSQPEDDEPVTLE